MNISLGLLSENNELIEDCKSSTVFEFIKSYKNFESLKKDDYSVLLIDNDIFDSPDLVQFYLSKIRKKFQDLPILLIIRVSDLEDVNFDWFFDDFILFPFRKGEIDVRLKKLMWQLGDDENTLSVGHLTINLKEYSVYLNNQKIELTYKEFELLRLFLQNRGEVFSRKDLLNKIWGMEYIGGTRTVDVHIRRLRGKLGDEFNSIIETVRNVGYRCKD